MIKYSAERVARLGVTVLFLALVRTIGEYYRLRHTLGPEGGLAAFAPYVPALGIGVLGTWASVLLCFGRRYPAAITVAGLTVAVLLVYRLAVIP